LRSGSIACKYAGPPIFRSTRKTSMIGGQGWEQQWKSRTKMMSRGQPLLVDPGGQKGAPRARADSIELELKLRSSASVGIR
jgi:hypothetical protein